MKKGYEWKLKENVRKLSKCQDYPDFIKEWDRITDECICSEVVCICSNTNHKRYWRYHNRLTDKFIDVGSG